MRNETSADYRWAMRHIQEVFQAYGLVTAPTFVTDRELALMNVLDETFPNAHCLLCRWYTRKNILAKQRSTFETLETWKELTKLGTDLMLLQPWKNMKRNLGYSIPPSLQPRCAMLRRLGLHLWRNLSLFSFAINAIMATLRYHA